jgi:hypothetical protein
MATTDRDSLFHSVRRILMALAVLWSAGCNSGSGGTTCYTTIYCLPTGGLVSILPASAIVAAGESFQFTASEPNTDHAEIVWKVNGVIGGRPETGSISPTGLYTAPAINQRMPLQHQGVASVDLG